MKKIISVIVLLIFAVACSKKKDFSKIHEGMNSKDVIKIVGQPDEKTDIFGAELWMYKASEGVGYMVGINNDTVSVITGGKELEDLFLQMNEGLDSLQQTLDHAQKILDDL